MIIKDANNGKVTIGSSSTAALAANGGRIGGTIVNDSDEIMYIAFGEAAVMNSGIRLNADGGNYSFPQDQIYTGAVNAICTSGSKNLSYIEYTK